MLLSDIIRRRIISSVALSKRIKRVVNLVSTSSASLCKDGCPWMALCAIRDFFLGFDYGPDHVKVVIPLKKNRSINLNLFVSENISMFLIYCYIHSH